MNKRTFIKLSTAAVSSSLLSPLQSLAQQQPLKNWAGNFTYGTSNVSYPSSIDEIRTLLKGSGKMKILGSRHCFSKIADSKNKLLSMRQLNKLIAIDAKAKTVTIEGGMNYGQLCPILQQNGLALHNLASLPHISVAGAITTATHGSGMKNGNLSTGVASLEIMNAEGEIILLSKEKDGEKFHACVVGLGAVGAITKVTLAVQPAYQMRQRVYLQLPMSSVRSQFAEIMSAGYSVSLFTDWQTEMVNEVWIKSLASDASSSQHRNEFYGAKAATKNVHPIVELAAENCTDQMGVDGPWYERLPHFKMGFTPSSGTELQSEYFVPREHAVDAIDAVKKHAKAIGPHLYISEIRAIEGDQFWMSTCYQRPSIAIHFTWKQEWDEVIKLLPIIEKSLEPFNARPHWGKIHTMTGAKLASLYPRMQDFKKIASSFDPKGKFRNEYLDNYVFG